MENAFLLVVTAVLCAIAATTVTWLAMRTRSLSALDAAKETAAFEVKRLETEFGGCRERLAALEEQIRRSTADNTDLQKLITKLRDDLGMANADCARLGERASRVPQLESQLALEVAALRDARSLVASSEERTQQIPELQAKLKASGESLGEANREITDLRASEARLQEQLRQERTTAQEKLQLLEDAEQKLSTQFENLANKILEDKSQRFTEQNKANLGEILNPLKEQIATFKSKVEEVYVKEGQERSALGGQVKELMALSQNIGDEARNLTRALKGSAKTQGDWGEIVLERLLEMSGLTRGVQYVAQESVRREDGSRAVPDVLLRLPGDRNLIIDAKVSLNAYEEYAGCDSEEDRSSALKRHLESLKNHIKGLADRNYQALYQIKSLDCVLMFIPIEPAFMLAVASDREIFRLAWDRNVILVSPSTLLFVVRTAAHLWRQEAQSRNAQEIAKRGADLYDKFVAFVEDITQIGARIDQTQKVFEQAHRKLTGGRGNLIRQAEMLRDLGVKPSKALPADLIDLSLEDLAVDEQPVAQQPALDVLPGIPDA